MNSSFSSPPLRAARGPRLTKASAKVRPFHVTAKLRGAFFSRKKPAGRGWKPRTGAEHAVAQQVATAERPRPAGKLFFPGREEEARGRAGSGGPGRRERGTEEAERGGGEGGRPGGERRRRADGTPLPPLAGITREEPSPRGAIRYGTDGQGEGRPWGIPGTGKRARTWRRPGTPPSRTRGHDTRGGTPGLRAGREGTAGHADGLAPLTFLHRNALCRNIFRKKVKAVGEGPVKAAGRESSP